MQGNSHILMANNSLDDRECNIIDGIKSNLHNIVTRNFKVVFDMGDTLNTMYSKLYSDLGLFERYTEPTYETIRDGDRLLLDRLLLDSKYLEVSTYNLDFDISKDKFKKLGNLIGFKNIVNYFHCCSLEIANYKYEKIKE